MTKFPTAVAAFTGAAALVVAGCGQEKRPTPKIPAPPTQQQVIDSAANGVVAIKARTENNVYIGTGWAVAPGQIITAAHVPYGAQNIKIRFKDGTVAPARIVGESVCNDRALLELTQDVPNMTILPMADGSQLNSNARVDLLHYGLSSSSDFGREQMQTNALTVANPRVQNPSLGAALPRLTDLIQFNGESPGGASGAPMLNADGRVVGVLTIGDSRQTWALPIGQISQGLADLRAGDRSDSIGVEVRPFNDVDLPSVFANDPSYQSSRLGRLVAAYIRAAHLEGLYVDGVADDGPANRKVFYGDMITHVNDVRVRSVRGMCGAIQSAAPGQKITIRGLTLNGGSTAKDVLSEWKETVRLRK